MPCVLDTLCWDFALRLDLTHGFVGEINFELPLEFTVEKFPCLTPSRQSTTSLVSPLPYPCMMGQRTRRR